MSTPNKKDTSIQFKQLFFTSFLLVVTALSGVTVSAQSTPLKVPRIESRETPEVKRATPIPKSSLTETASFSTLSSETTQTAQAQTAGPNLISNPSFESSLTATPGWGKGGYGTNTRIFSFPVTGFASNNAVRVSISNYTSGDAKWYFADVPVIAGRTYQFSNYSISNIPSIVTVRYKMSDGTFKYVDLATIPASSTYNETVLQFVTPQNVVSLTIFHLIKQVGSLTTDEYSLNDVTVPPPSDNLVLNGGFETMDSTGGPANWKKGRWGTNTTKFTYTATGGVSGSRAAEVSITSYTSGDAKWYFTSLPLEAGVYTYSDQYVSDVVSLLTVQYQNNDGSFFYKEIATLPPASTFTTASAEFFVPANVQNVTIFHLIKSVGNLKIDNVSLKFKWPLTGVFTNGAVTLTFDDGLLSQYQNALPKLNSAGLKGTFFIITRQMYEYGYPGFLSRPQVSEMYQSGHEISAHTRTHRALSQLSSTVQQAEIAGSRQDLLAMNVGPIVSFAYPLGDYNATTLQIVKDAGFMSARTTMDGNATPTSDRHQLQRLGLTASTTAAQVKQWIDTAIAKKEWLVLTFHTIDTSGTLYSTTPTIFNEIIDYLVQKNVKVVTLAEGISDVAP